MGARHEEHLQKVPMTVSCGGEELTVGYAGWCDPPRVTIRANHSPKYVLYAKDQGTTTDIVEVPLGESFYEGSGEAFIEEFATYEEAREYRRRVFG